MGTGYESIYCSIIYARLNDGQKEHMERYKILKFGVYQACATDGPKLLVKYVCKTALKSLLWVTACAPGFEYAP